MTARADRFTNLLTAATVATYAVVALGAALASRDAATCGTWPGCAESGLLAIGHRIAAVVAAGALLLAAWYALRIGTSRRSSSYGNPCRDRRLPTTPTSE